jgi:tRNA A-37 threonylcarbamoyl transferase component Bud32
MRSRALVFRALEAGRVRLWVDPELESAARAGHPGRLHLRPVRPRGWLAPLRSPGLLCLARPLAELRTASRLRAAGVPVARPALVVGRRRGLRWQVVVGSVLEEDAQDGRAFLASRPSVERVMCAARAAARALRRLHEAGGVHGDLHVGNLLLREQGGRAEVVIVDLDRARVAPAPLAPRLRTAQLVRLYRSLEKLENNGHAGRVGPRVLARFLADYTDGDRALRRALWSHLPAQRLRLRLHRLGWATAAWIRSSRGSGWAGRSPARSPARADRRGPASTGGS